MRAWHVVVSAILLLALQQNTALAQPATAPAAEQPHATDATAPDQPWLVWHTQGFFDTCDGNCAAGFYAGRQITTAMTRVFLLRRQVAPWNVQGGDGGIVAGTVSRRVVTLFGGLDIEAEAGLGQRFGNMHATELWTALDFRWTEFPWNDFLKTTIGFSEGINYATSLDRAERHLSNGNRDSNVLNFFSPELTFALPSHPDDELVFRFHHRSGIFGAIGGVDAGLQFGTVGYRRRF